MRIVLGVNEPAYSRRALHLLERLKFRGATVDALHAIEMVPIAAWPEMPAEAWDAATQCQQEWERDAIALTDKTARELNEHGFMANSVVRRGGAAEQLMQYAEEVEAGLIAVGSRQESPLEAFFAGSVSRGLVIGAQQSILVAKGEPASTGPITAVLATDHSTYMNGCINRFAELAPQGIEKLIVVTAYDVKKRALEALLPRQPELRAEWIQTFEQTLHSRNVSVGERLQREGLVCESRVIAGPAVAVINSVMRESSADLLILGAHGHDFVERLAVGSLSFHMVMSEPHSVLILRGGHIHP